MPRVVVVVVVVLALIAAVLAFVVVAFELDCRGKGRSGVATVHVRVHVGCPGALCWSLLLFSASVCIRVRVRWLSKWPRERSCGLTGLEGGLGRWDALCDVA